jgi:hypothetical protein
MKFYENLTTKRLDAGVKKRIYTFSNDSKQEKYDLILIGDFNIIIQTVGITICVSDGEKN